MTEVVFSGWHSDVTGRTTVHIDREPFLTELPRVASCVPWLYLRWGAPSLQANILAEALLNKVTNLFELSHDITSAKILAFAELHVERWPWPGGWYLSSEVVVAFLDACKTWESEQEEGVDLAALKRELMEECNTPEAEGNQP